MILVKYFYIILKIPSPFSSDATTAFVAFENFKIWNQMIPDFVDPSDFITVGTPKVILSECISDRNKPLIAQQNGSRQASPSMIDGDN